MEAVETVSRGDADSLVVWRADRLGRLAVDGFWLLDRAKREGWSLVDLEAGADSSTRQGEFLWGLRMVVAQDERRAISDRTRDAMAIAKSRKVVSRIVRERRAQETLASIGQGLERDGVPTAHGGARWYPATVLKVLQSQTAAKVRAKK